MHENVLAVVTLLAIGFLSTRLAAWLRVPHSVFLVVLGLVVGLLLAHHQSVFPVNLGADFSDLVFCVLLPPLIFESAYHLDLAQLRRDLVGVVALSTVGLVISCIAIGAGIHYAFGISFTAALLFGALISATDPVAVVALFKDMGAPRRLATLVEGESLLNDGTAIVLFRVLIALPMGAALGASTVLSIAVKFVIVTVSGLLIGLVFIALASWALRLTETSATAQVGLTVVSAYASFLTADMLQSSGVMATLMVGLYLGNRARLELNREAYATMQSLWAFLALSANTLVFLTVGLTVQAAQLWSAAPLLPATLVIVYMTRALSVGATLLPLNLLGWIPRIGPRYQTVLVWGGLRGGLALALVLVMPNEHELKPAFLAMTTAVVLASLLLNGATTGALMRALRLDQLSQAERILYRISLRTVFERVFATLHELAARGSMSKALVEQLEARAIGGLEVSEEGSAVLLEGVEVMSAEVFDVQHVLLHEQEYYDDQLDDGVLSVRAYETLARSVRQRLDLLAEAGSQGLLDFQFDITVRESWLHRRLLRRRTRVEGLGTTLEILLHLEHALRHVMGRCEAVARGHVEAWLSQCEEKLRIFHQEHPQLELAVQSEFIAHSVAASANSALQELHDAEALSGAVYARALRRVARIHADLLGEARRRIKPPLRDLLIHHSAFSDIPEDVLQTVEREARWSHHDGGVKLQLAPDALHLVYTGELEVRENGTTRTFGAGTVVEPAQRVTTMRKTEMVAIPRTVLEDITANRPQGHGLDPRAGFLRDGEG